MRWPGPGPGPQELQGAPRCSAKGCRSDGAWELRWNNPTLHTPERRKVWLACDAHRQSLSEFLSLRGFLRETAPLPRSADAVSEADETMGVGDTRSDDVTRSLDDAGSDGHTNA